jgi:hypothetical protein
MNVVAIIPKLVMRLLQSQNVKRKVAPVMDNNTVPKETIETDNKEN